LDWRLWLVRVLAAFRVRVPMGVRVLVLRFGAKERRWLNSKAAAVGGFEVCAPTVPTVVDR